MSKERINNSTPEGNEDVLARDYVYDKIKGELMDFQKTNPEAYKSLTSTSQYSEFEYPTDYVIRHKKNQREILSKHIPSYNLLPEGEKFDFVKLSHEGHATMNDRYPFVNTEYFSYDDDEYGIPKIQEKFSHPKMQAEGQYINPTTGFKEAITTYRDPITGEDKPIKGGITDKPVSYKEAAITGLSIGAFGGSFFPGAGTVIGGGLGLVAATAFYFSPLNEVDDTPFMAQDDTPLMWGYGANKDQGFHFIPRPKTDAEYDKAIKEGYADTNIWNEKKDTSYQDAFFKGLVNTSKNIGGLTDYAYYSTTSTVGLSDMDDYNRSIRERARTTYPMSYDFNKLPIYHPKKILNLVAEQLPYMGAIGLGGRALGLMYGGAGSALARIGTGIVNKSPIAGGFLYGSGKFLSANQAWIGMGQFVSGQAYDEFNQAGYSNRESKVMAYMSGLTFGAIYKNIGRGLGGNILDNKILNKAFFDNKGYQNIFKNAHKQTIAEIGDTLTSVAGKEAFKKNIVKNTLGWIKAIGLTGFEEGTEEVLEYSFPVMLGNAYDIAIRNLGIDSKEGNMGWSYDIAQQNFTVGAFMGGILGPLANRSKGDFNSDQADIINKIRKYISEDKDNNPQSIINYLKEEHKRKNLTRKNDDGTVKYNQEGLIQYTDGKLTSGTINKDDLLAANKFIKDHNSTSTKGKDFIEVEGNEIDLNNITENDYRFLDAIHKVKELQHVITANDHYLNNIKDRLSYVFSSQQNSAFNYDTEYFSKKDEDNINERIGKIITNANIDLIQQRHEKVNKESTDIKQMGLKQLEKQAKEFDGNLATFSLDVLKKEILTRKAEIDTIQQNIIKTMEGENILDLKLNLVLQKVLGAINKEILKEADPVKKLELLRQKEVVVNNYLYENRKRQTERFGMTLGGDIKAQQIQQVLTAESILKGSKNESKEEVEHLRKISEEGKPRTYFYELISDINALIGAIDYTDGGLIVKLTEKITELIGYSGNGLVIDDALLLEIDAIVKKAGELYEEIKLSSSGYTETENNIINSYLASLAPAQTTQTAAAPAPATQPTQSDYDKVVELLATTDLKDEILAAIRDGDKDVTPLVDNGIDKSYIDQLIDSRANPKIIANIPDYLDLVLANSQLKEIASIYSNRVNNQVLVVEGNQVKNVSFDYSNNPVNTPAKSITITKDNETIVINADTKYEDGLSAINKYIAKYIYSKSPNDYFDVYKYIGTVITEFSNRISNLTVGVDSTYEDFLKIQNQLKRFEEFLNDPSLILNNTTKENGVSPAEATAEANEIVKFAVELLQGYLAKTEKIVVENGDNLAKRDSTFMEKTYNDGVLKSIKHVLEKIGFSSEPFFDKLVFGITDMAKIFNNSLIIENIISNKSKEIIAKFEELQAAIIQSIETSGEDAKKALLDKGKLVDLFSIEQDGKKNIAGKNGVDVESFFNVDSFDFESIKALQSVYYQAKYFQENGNKVSEYGFNAFVKVALASESNIKATLEQKYIGYRTVQHILSEDKNSGSFENSILVNGYAGTGKTTAMRSVFYFLKSISGTKKLVIGITSPKEDARDALFANATAAYGANSPLVKSIQSLKMYSSAVTTELDNIQVLFVDEAAFLDTKNNGSAGNTSFFINEYLKEAAKQGRNIRVVSIGDPIQAVSYDIETAYNTQTRKNAIKNRFITGNASSAFNIKILPLLINSLRTSIRPIGNFVTAMRNLTINGSNNNSVMDKAKGESNRNRTYGVNIQDDEKQLFENLAHDLKLASDAKNKEFHGKKFVLITDDQDPNITAKLVSYGIDTSKIDLRTSKNAQGGTWDRAYIYNIDTTKDNMDLLARNLYVNGSRPIDFLELSLQGFDAKDNEVDDNNSISPIIRIDAKASIDAESIIIKDADKLYAELKKERDEAEKGNYKTEKLKSLSDLQASLTQAVDAAEIGNIISQIHALVDSIYNDNFDLFDDVDIIKAIYDIHEALKGKHATLNDKANSFDASDLIAWVGMNLDKVLDKVNNNSKYKEYYKRILAIIDGYMGISSYDVDPINLAKIDKIDDAIKKKEDENNNADKINISDIKDENFTDGEVDIKDEDDEFGEGKSYYTDKKDNTIWKRVTSFVERFKPAFFVRKNIAFNTFLYEHLIAQASNKDIANIANVSDLAASYKAVIPYITELIGLYKTLGGMKEISEYNGKDEFLEALRKIDKRPLSTIKTILHNYSKSSVKDHNSVMMLVDAYVTLIPNEYEKKRVIGKLFHKIIHKAIKSRVEKKDGSNFVLSTSDIDEYVNLYNELLESNGVKYSRESIEQLFTKELFKADLRVFIKSIFDSIAASTGSQSIIVSEIDPEKFIQFGITPDATILSKAYAGRADLIITVGGKTIFYDYKTSEKAYVPLFRTSFHLHGLNPITDTFKKLNREYVGQGGTIKYTSKIHGYFFEMLFRGYIYYKGQPGSISNGEIAKALHENLIVTTYNSATGKTENVRISDSHTLKTETDLFNQEGLNETDILNILELFESNIKSQIGVDSNKFIYEEEKHTQVMNEDTDESDIRAKYDGDLLVNNMYYVTTRYADVGGEDGISIPIKDQSHDTRVRRAKAINKILLMVKEKTATLRVVFNHESAASSDGTNSGSAFQLQYSENGKEFRTLGTYSVYKQEQGKGLLVDRIKPDTAEDGLGAKYIQVIEKFIKNIAGQIGNIFETNQSNVSIKSINIGTGSYANLSDNANGLDGITEELRKNGFIKESSIDSLHSNKKARTYIGPYVVTNESNSDGLKNGQAYITYVDDFNVVHNIKLSVATIKLKAVIEKFNDAINNNLIDNAGLNKLIKQHIVYTDRLGLDTSIRTKLYQNVNLQSKKDGLREYVAILEELRNKKRDISIYQNVVIASLDKNKSALDLDEGARNIADIDIESHGIISMPKMNFYEPRIEVPFDNPSHNPINPANTKSSKIPRINPIGDEAFSSIEDGVDVAAAETEAIETANKEIRRLLSSRFARDYADATLVERTDPKWWGRVLFASDVASKTRIELLSIGGRAKRFTARHEAFHVLFNELTDPVKRAELLVSARIYFNMQSSGYSDRDVEEEMAKQFENRYKNVPAFLIPLFRFMDRMISFFVGHKTIFNKYLSDLDQGGYNDMLDSKQYSTNRSLYSIIQIERYIKNTDLVGYDDEKQTRLDEKDKRRQINNMIKIIGQTFSSYLLDSTNIEIYDENFAINETIVDRYLKTELDGYINGYKEDIINNPDMSNSTKEAINRFIYSFEYVKDRNRLYEILALAFPEVGIFTKEEKVENKTDNESYTENEGAIPETEADMNIKASSIYQDKTHVDIEKTSFNKLLMNILEYIPLYSHTSNSDTPTGIASGKHVKAVLYRIGAEYINSSSNNKLDELRRGIITFYNDKKNIAANRKIAFSLYKTFFSTSELVYSNEAKEYILEYTADKSQFTDETLYGALSQVIPTQDELDIRNGWVDEGVDEGVTVRKRITTDHYIRRRLYAQQILSMMEYFSDINETSLKRDEMLFDKNGLYLGIIPTRSPYTSFISDWNTILKNYKASNKYISTDNSNLVINDRYTITRNSPNDPWTIIDNEDLSRTFSLAIVSQKYMNAKDIAKIEGFTDLFMQIGGGVDLVHFKAWLHNAQSSNNYYEINKYVASLEKIVTGMVLTHTQDPFDLELLKSPEKDIADNARKYLDDFTEVFDKTNPEEYDAQNSEKDFENNRIYKYGHNNGYTSFFKSLFNGKYFGKQITDPFLLHNPLTKELVKFSNENNATLLNEHEKGEYITKKLLKDKVLRVFGYKKITGIKGSSVSRSAGISNMNAFEFIMYQLNGYYSDVKDSGFIPFIAGDSGFIVWVKDNYDSAITGLIDIKNDVVANILFYELIRLNVGQEQGSSALGVTKEQANRLFATTTDYATFKLKLEGNTVDPLFNELRNLRDIQIGLRDAAANELKDRFRGKLTITTTKDDERKTIKSDDGQFDDMYQKWFYKNMYHQYFHTQLIGGNVADYGTPSKQTKRLKPPMAPASSMGIYSLLNDFDRIKNGLRRVFVADKDNVIGESTEAMTQQQPTQIKEGVAELFESNPELANQVYNSLGISLDNGVTDQIKLYAQQQYSEYLDSIFPDSKVKDIVYHGTDKKFDEFNNSNLPDSGIYFEKNKMTAYGYGNILIPAILNSSGYYYGGNLNRVNSKQIRENGETGLTNGSGNIVFEPEQIHILGSQQDIEDFKYFAAYSNIHQPTQQSPDVEVIQINQVFGKLAKDAKITTTDGQAIINPLMMWRIYMGSAGNLGGMRFSSMKALHSGMDYDNGTATVLKYSHAYPSTQLRMMEIGSAYTNALRKLYGETELNKEEKKVAIDSIMAVQNSIDLIILKRIDKSGTQNLTMQDQLEMEKRYTSIIDIAKNNGLEFYDEYVYPSGKKTGLKETTMLPNEDWRIQQVLNKDDKHNKALMFLRQSFSMIVGGVNNKIYVDRLSGILTNFYKFNKERFLDSFISDASNIVDFSKFRSSLVESYSKDNRHDEVLMMLEDMKVSHNNPGIVQTLLERFSIIIDDIINPRVFGGMYVLVSTLNDKFNRNFNLKYTSPKFEEGFDDKAHMELLRQAYIAKNEELLDSLRKEYLSKIIEVGEAECMMPYKFIKEFGIEMNADGTYPTVDEIIAGWKQSLDILEIQYNNKIIERDEIGTEVSDEFLEDDRIARKTISDKITNFEKSLQVFGYRLPLVGKNATVALRIKGFFTSNQNSIMVPDEVVLVHGSDFDIDELNVIQPHLIEGKYYTYDDISKLSEEQVAKYTDKLLSNSILDLLREVVLDTSNFESVIEPNSVSLLETGRVGEIKMEIEKSKNLDGLSFVLDPLGQLNAYLSNIIIKMSIGILGNGYKKNALKNYINDNIPQTKGFGKEKVIVIAKKNYSMLGYRGKGDKETDSNGVPIATTFGTLFQAAVDNPTYQYLDNLGFTLSNFGVACEMISVGIPLVGVVELFNTNGVKALLLHKELNNNAFTKKTKTEGDEEENTRFNIKDYVTEAEAALAQKDIDVYKHFEKIYHNESLLNKTVRFDNISKSDVAFLINYVKDIENVTKDAPIAHNIGKNMVDLAELMLKDANGKYITHFPYTRDAKLKITSEKPNHISAKESAFYRMITLAPHLKAQIEVVFAVMQTMQANFSIMSNTYLSSVLNRFELLINKRITDSKTLKIFLSEVDRYFIQREMVSRKIKIEGYGIIENETSLLSFLYWIESPVEGGFLHNLRVKYGNMPFVKSLEKSAGNLAVAYISNPSTDASLQFRNDLESMDAWERNALALYSLAKFGSAQSRMSLLRYLPISSLGYLDNLLVKEDGTRIGSEKTITNGELDNIVLQLITNSTYLQNKYLTGMEYVSVKEDKTLSYSADQSDKYNNELDARIKKVPKEVERMYTFGFGSYLDRIQYSINFFTDKMKTLELILTKDKEGKYELNSDGLEYAKMEWTEYSSHIDKHKDYIKASEDLISVDNNGKITLTEKGQEKLDAEVASMRTRMKGSDPEYIEKSVKGYINRYKISVFNKLKTAKKHAEGEAKIDFIRTEEAFNKKYLENIIQKISTYKEQLFRYEGMKSANLGKDKEDTTKGQVNPVYIKYDKIKKIFSYKDNEMYPVSGQRIFYFGENAKTFASYPILLDDHVQNELIISIAEHFANQSEREFNKTLPYSPNKMESKTIIPRYIESDKNPTPYTHINTNYGILLPVSIDNENNQITISLNREDYKQFDNVYKQIKKELDMDKKQLEKPANPSDNKINPLLSTEGELVSTNKLKRFTVMLSKLFGISVKFYTNNDLIAAGLYSAGKVIPKGYWDRETNTINISISENTLETPLHEFAHVFVTIIKNENRLLYNRLIHLIALDTELVERIKNTYGDYYGDNMEKIHDEALVTRIGQIARGEFTQTDGLIARYYEEFKNVLKDFWKRIKEYLGLELNIENKRILKGVDNIENLTINDIANLFVKNIKDRKVVKYTPAKDEDTNTKYKLPDAQTTTVDLIEEWNNADKDNNIEQKRYITKLSFTENADKLIAKGILNVNNSDYLKKQITASKFDNAEEYFNFLNELPGRIVENIAHLINSPDSFSNVDSWNTFVADNKVSKDYVEQIEEKFRYIIDMIGEGKATVLFADNKEFGLTSTPVIVVKKELDGKEYIELYQVATHNEKGEFAGRLAFSGEHTTGSENNSYTAQMRMNLALFMVDYKLKNPTADIRDIKLITLSKEVVERKRTNKNIIESNIIRDVFFHSLIKVLKKRNKDEYDKLKADIKNRDLLNDSKFAKNPLAIVSGFVGDLNNMINELYSRFYKYPNSIGDEDNDLIVHITSELAGKQALSEGDISAFAVRFSQPLDIMNSIAKWLEKENFRAETKRNVDTKNFVNKFNSLFNQLSNKSEDLLYKAMVDPTHYEKTEDYVRLYLSNNDLTSLNEQDDYIAYDSDAYAQHVRSLGYTADNDVKILRELIKYVTEETKEKYYRSIANDIETGIKVVDLKIGYFPIRKDRDKLAGFVKNILMKPYALATGMIADEGEQVEKMYDVDNYDPQDLANQNRIPVANMWQSDILIVDDSFSKNMLQVYAGFMFSANNKYYKDHIWYASVMFKRFTEISKRLTGQDLSNLGEWIVRWRKQHLLGVKELITNNKLVNELLRKVTTYATMSTFGFQWASNIKDFATGHINIYGHKLYEKLLEKKLESYTLGNILEATKIVFSEVGAIFFSSGFTNKVSQNKNDRSKLLAFMWKTGLFLDKYSTGQYATLGKGVDFRSNYLFALAMSVDFVNNAIVMVAQLKKLGVWDSYEMVEVDGIYDLQPVEGKGRLGDTTLLKVRRDARYGEGDIVSDENISLDDLNKDENLWRWGVLSREELRRIAAVNTRLFGGYTALNKPTIVNNNLWGIPAGGRHFMFNQIEKLFGGAGMTSNYGYAAMESKEGNEIVYKWNADRSIGLWYEIMPNGEYVEIPETEILNKMVPRSYSWRETFQQGRYASLSDLMLSLEMNRSFLKSGKESWNKLNQTQKANIKKTAADGFTALVIFALYSGLDDEDKDTWYVKFMKRIYGEVFAGVNPTELLNSADTYTLVVALNRYWGIIRHFSNPKNMGEAKYFDDGFLKIVSVVPGGKTAIDITSTLTSGQ